MLVHYDPAIELILACDASPYGVGAVLSHRFSDTEENPIIFALRSLGAAEQKYSQLEKEGLAIVFRVKKFHLPEGSIEERLSRFLFWYRLTPHSTTGVSPAELLLGRRPRSKLDFLKPTLSERVQSKMDMQKKHHDTGTKLRTFKLGECEDPFLIWLNCVMDEWLSVMLMHCLQE